MKKDKILIFLFVGLAVAVVALYFYKKSKAAKRTAEKFPLMVGSSGKAVKMVQCDLKLPLTGVYDAATAAKVDAEYNLDSIDATDFTDRFFGNLNTDPGVLFPTYLGQKGFMASWIQILLGVPVTGTIDSVTVEALKNNTGLTQLSALDYRNLIHNTLGV